MSLGRRKVALADASGWVFNRMVDAYGARPPYPSALVHALGLAAGKPNARIADIGAGIGHLALPLCELGFEVLAVEPAEQMLEQLRRLAAARTLSLATFHATAEALPIASGSVDLVLIADALHFLDAELASSEVRRVLAKRGALAVVTSEFAPTPFMQALSRLMDEAAPRRARAVAPALAQLAALSRVRLGQRQTFGDSAPVDALTLERILRSISFIGPAMTPQRFSAFFQRVLAIPYPAVWARSFALHSGRRGGRRAHG
ncbi:MAG TPA: class I SAM-dependent methyltransferase [Polyangiaceae bacterium]|nr:class I SAM-dependent methyltransferase [Polyangiaceae bacterium]